MLFAYGDLQQIGSYPVLLVCRSFESEFDAQNGEPGWNALGSFELADGEVRVRVPNVVEDGDYVMADAIRWTRIDGGQAAVETE